MRSECGTRPPALAGRDKEIEAYEILLDRLKDGTVGQSMVRRPKNYARTSDIAPDAGSWSESVPGSTATVAC